MEKQPQTGRPKGKEEISCLEESIGEEHLLRAAIYGHHSCKEGAEMILSWEVQRIKFSQRTMEVMEGDTNPPMQV